MKPSFRLAQHPRRWPQPQSGPPAGYFEQLPTRIMAQVAVPARRRVSLAWLLQAPMSMRTCLASTLLLGTFAVSLWLGGGPAQPSPTPLARLDGVPQEQLMDYLLTSEAHVDMTDLAELPAQHLGITQQYLRPSASELTAALDDQPADDAALL
ncbi:hypothetical protein GO988_02895 [Hymenobacter sp. HMF4947]|uniref:Uncharacterized protein n=1 Tax=Hymenobacter ginkgonis TaxID=2682976 RepID=A0A7K1TA36_9BACT|nr:hypothetical protein [Hymenobacter ginkgonis]MVN75264.1 hypothetical protein [Hymenobacter ginkgonis]